MVRRGPALSFLVPFEHGEVGDPEKAKIFGGIARLFKLPMTPSILLRQRHSQQASSRIDGMIVLLDLRLHPALGLMLRRFAVARNHHNQVFRFGAALLPNFCRRLRKRFLQALEIFKQLGAALRRQQRLDLVAFFSRQFPNLRDSNGDDWQIRIHCQRLQILCHKYFPHIGHRRQAHVGLVAAVKPNRFVIAHARERRLNLVSRGLERRGQKSFNHFPNPLRLRIRHLQIDLGKFRLPVGTQVFIAEATHNLKIFVAPGDHQNLLEQLRRLRQRIKRSWLHPAGDEIIARSLRRRSRHERRFDFKESLQ